jgi:hypothetical protein
MGSGGTAWEDQDSISLARMNQKTTYIGPTEPTTMYAGMPWFDTSVNKLYERNANNSGWLQVYPVVVAGLNSQTEVDFGDLTYVTEKTFTVVDANVTATSKITAQLAYEAPTNKQLDEVEMDDLVILCGQCATGSFSMVITSLTGSLYGKFKINYMIG